MVFNRRRIAINFPIILARIALLNKSLMQQTIAWRRHFSISLMAVAFVGSNIFITSDKSNSRLSELFLPDPAAISTIVSGISPYTPTVDENPDAAAMAMIDPANQSYIEQVSVLAMSQDNQYAGFAISYQIQNGDTWSAIAKKNNLHTASVFAANGIDEAKLKKGLPKLTPGDKITIPAEDIDGGPTNWVSILNDINTAKQQAKSGATPKSKTKKSNAITNRTGRDFTSYGGYPGGYCTSYVASRRSVGNWGNAGHWLIGARSDGFSTGSTPRAGDIMVTGESGFGHVAYVESVNGSVVTVSEENYKGFGVVSTRTVDIKSIPLKGFIH